MDYKKRESILCIDLKSFYASCSCIKRGLDPLTTYLAVVGATDRQGSVVLAATPLMKQKYRIKTGSRLFEIPQHKEIHIVNAEMKYYLDMSMAVTKILHRFASREDLHIYSIDEAFIRVNPVERIFGDKWSIARRIKTEIFEELGLTVAIGIGENMLLSKLCLDLEAKKTTEGIAEWTYESVPQKLWPVTPLSEMWGIGKKTQNTLNRMGIVKVGDLAHYPLELLEKNFGIMGNQLYYHAHGIDHSDLGAPIMMGQISFGKSQILLRDYSDKEEVKHVILEICEEIARRTRSARKAGRTINLGIGYSKDSFGGGFNRSKTIDQPTNITMDVYKVCLELFEKFYNGDVVRSIDVRLLNIVDDSEIQLSLFDLDNPKRSRLGYTMDEIRRKHGSASLLRGVSFTQAGTAIHRSKLIGGHKG
nr:UV damage repair protein UvrX [Fictibacillus marinisediminis]